MPKITICIPTHDMDSKEAFLLRSLHAIAGQKFRDFDVVVTDNSEDDRLGKVCRVFWSFPISYFKNPVKGMAQNSNEAIRRSTGSIVKILYLDDYLAGEDALGDIVGAFEGRPEQWLVGGCDHSWEGDVTAPHMPVWSDRMLEGDNTIGSPSVMAVRNIEPLLFDERMTWLLDCDLYDRYRERHGLPIFLESIIVTMGLGAHQATHTLSDEVKLGEHYYLREKQNAKKR